MTDIIDVFRHLIRESGDEAVKKLIRILINPNKHAIIEAMRIKLSHEKALKAEAKNGTMLSKAGEGDT